MLRKNAPERLCGTTTVSVCGKAVRRTGQCAVIFDSFCGLPVLAKHTETQEEIDKSIEGNYLVRLLCRAVHQPRLHLVALSVQRITFQEEMYRTLESVEYWNKLLFQKQPK